MTTKVYSPWAGEFYNDNAAIRFRIRQAITQTEDYTHNPIPSYIAASSHLLNVTPVRNTSASYPFWNFNLRHELTPILPFANEQEDTFFDLPIIASNGGIVIDNSALTQEATITVPIATSANDLTIQYPSNNDDPPVITNINYSDSFDYTIGYYEGAGAVSRSNFGTFNNNINLDNVLTRVDLRVTFPSFSSSSNTKFFNRLQIYKPSTDWVVRFDLQLRQFNHNSSSYTY